MIPMRPEVDLPGSRAVVFGADQPQYHSLPARMTPDGIVMTEWELSAAELDAVCRGARLRLWVHTYGQPLQPLMLEVVGVVEGA